MARKAVAKKTPRKPQASAKPPTVQPADTKSIEDEDALAGKMLTEALDAPRSTSSVAAELPIGTIVASPLNPRRAMDPESLRELADSIVANGLLQPILVRPIYADPVDDEDSMDLDAYKVTSEEWAEGRRPEAPPGYEIICGARRHAAAGLAVGDGRLPADFRVPVRIRECTDAELVVLAATENLARRDMAPLEEAEVFATLRAHVERREGEKAEAAVARVLGTSERTVFRRLSLLRLAPELQTALSEGEINLSQAAAFSVGDEATQKAQLGKMRGGPDWVSAPREIRAQMTKKRVAVEGVSFDASLYTGEIVEDPETGQRFFASPDECAHLFKEAILAKEAELAKVWPWVDLIQGGYVPYNSYQQATRKDDRDAGAVLLIDRERLSFKVETPYLRIETVKERERARHAKSAPAKEVRVMTDGQVIAVKHAKTRAMRRRIATDHRAAIALAIMGMVHTQEIYLRADEHQGGPDNRVKPLAEDAERAKLLLAPVTAALKTDGAGEDWALYGGLSGGRAALVFNALMARELPELLDLHAGLVAGFVGDRFNQYGAGGKSGDSPLAIAIAETVGAAEELPATWSPDEAYFKAMSRERLERIVRQNDLVTPLNRAGCEWSALGKAKKGQLVAACLDVPEGFWTPDKFPETRFLDETAMSAAIAGPAPGAQPQQKEAAE